MLNIQHYLRYQTSVMKPAAVIRRLGHGGYCQRNQVAMETRETPKRTKQEIELCHTKFNLCTHLGVELTIYNPTAHKLNLFSAIFSHDQKNPSKTGTLMSNVSLELCTALMRQNLKRFNNLSKSEIKRQKVQQDLFIYHYRFKCRLTPVEQINSSTTIPGHCVVYVLHLQDFLNDKIKNEIAPHFTQAKAPDIAACVTMVQGVGVTITTWGDCKSSNLL